MSENQKSSLTFDLSVLNLDRLWEDSAAIALKALPAAMPDRPGLLPAFLSFMDAHRAKWFTTPASTRQSHHHAYRGGLFVHCCEVYNLMIALSQPLAAQPLLPPSYPTISISPASALLVAFLHDVHKLGDAAGHDYYEDNVSIKTGKVSDKIPFRTTEDYLKVSVVYHDQGPPNLPAEQAQFLINQGILADTPGGLQSLAYIHATAPALSAQLTEDEQFAIRHHDGAYGCSKYDLAGKETPLMIIAHAADSRGQSWE